MYLNTMQEVEEDAVHTMSNLLERRINGSILSAFVDYMKDIIWLTCHLDKFESQCLRTHAFRTFKNLIEKEGLGKRLIEDVRRYGNAPGDKGDYLLYMEYQQLNKKEDVALLN